MESVDNVEEFSPHSEPKSPVQWAPLRPRSATMIPYVEKKDSIDSILKSSTTSCPILELVTLSAHPTPRQKEQSSIQLEKNISKLETALTSPSPPLRTVSPFPGHPFVTDAESLQAAVAENPGRIFEAIQNLVNDRDALRAELSRVSAELQSMTDDLNNTRIDHKSARGRYEDLFRVANAKQVILWKYIESLHSQLAAAKGQPDTKFGGENGHRMGPNVLGGLGMGVAMEKWISDGMDGGIGPRHGDEGSEPGTENSSWTADSLGAKNLDPNAQAFIPHFDSPEKFRGRSPVKFVQERSPEQDWDILNPPTPTKYNQSYAVQEPVQDPPRGRQRLAARQDTRRNVYASGANESLNAALPPRWYGICPFSLANAGPCPLGVNCQFIPLCPNYNNESGIGCALFNKGGPNACRFAHEYRFCEQAVSNQSGGCVWEGDTLGRHPATMEQVKKKREIHMRIKAHKSTCAVSEWEARMMLLSMREAHGRGIFNGR